MLTILWLAAVAVVALVAYYAGWRDGRCASAVEAKRVIQKLCRWTRSAEAKRRDYVGYLARIAYASQARAGQLDSIGQGEN